MSLTRPASILKHLESTVPTDAELLARFGASRDAAAFEELVRRHGSLVLGVCRRVTGHPQDAEDAFQAVFLVLAQKAGSLRTASLLGNWLYGVAYRVALRARRAAGRRKAREVIMSNPPDVAAPATGPLLPELAPILDDELAALPTHYRNAIVLCDLQGASREEAAAALGVPEGTVSSRLANGRKRLAARLAKRGIALSVAALPGALAEARAATVVPAELVSQTALLASDVVAGGAVPRSLANLLKGGSTVQKTLLIGVVTVGMIAGAVFAARPGAEPPQKEPPKPPAVAENATQPPKADEPKPAPEKAATFTTRPKLRHSTDLSVSQTRAMLWNSTGTHIAVSGSERRSGFPVRPIVWWTGTAPGSPLLSETPRHITTLVAVAPDGKGIVTDLREYNLISGKHRLTFFRPRGDRDPQPGLLESTVQLEPLETHGYAFSDDRKTFRTIANHRAGNAVKQIEVLEVDAVTGTTGKSLLKLNWGWHALSANGKRLAVVDSELTSVTVYDVDTGAKAAEHKFAPDVPIELPGGKTFDIYRELAGQLHPTASLVFSPDGHRLFVARGIGRNVVLNADTGDALPKLDGVSLAQAYPDVHAFTADGRLLAMQISPFEAQAAKFPRQPKGGGAFGGPPQKDPPVALTAQNQVLTVWDTRTGKALKTWKSADGVRAAFCPTKPLLAILEPNGEAEARLGFWDFSAEVEKK